MYALIYSLLQCNTRLGLPRAIVHHTIREIELGNNKAVGQLAQRLVLATDLDQFPDPHE